MYLIGDKNNMEERIERLEGQFDRQEGQIDRLEGQIEKILKGLELERGTSYFAILV